MTTLSRLPPLKSVTHIDFFENSPKIVISSVAENHEVLSIAKSLNLTLRSKIKTQPQQRD